MKTKYYYIDSEGNTKRYRGNIEKIDGKLFGTLIEAKNTERISELSKETSGLVEKERTTIKSWKDINDVEHVLTEDENISNNEVIKFYEHKIPLIFTPAIEDKVYFTYFDKSTKKKVIYDGEVIEENGKYFGEI